MSADEFGGYVDEFVRLDGVDEEPSDWHNNGGINADGGDSGTKGRVFQRADASPEWLVVVVSEGSDGYEFEKVALAGFDGKNEDIEPPVEITDMASTLDGLGE
jgi:hypothetical protein